MRFAMLVLALLLAGCAADEAPEETSESVAPNETEADKETPEKREERLEITTVAVCEEFRAFEDDIEEGPTDQRIEERLSKIQTLGSLATEDMRETVTETGDIGTRDELLEWLNEIDDICVGHGH